MGWLDWANTYSGFLSVCATTVLVLVTGIYVWLTYHQLTLLRKFQKRQTAIAVLSIAEEIKSNAQICSYVNATPFALGALTAGIWALGIVPMAQETKIAILDAHHSAERFNGCLTFDLNSGLRDSPTFKELAKKNILKAAKQIEADTDFQSYLASCRSEFARD